jgi:hypothetical protein
MKTDLKRPRPVAGEAPSSDWFYDELMTAQPDAQREFFRARLLQPREHTPADKLKR